jgi:ABC-type sugar transport system ATPase subunit
MARIELKNVSKAYSAFRAVDRLDLEIADGELVVLLGPSGCGKTTTMNMIAGLTTPSSGNVLFDDRDVTAQPPHRRNIAMVFQSSLLYPHLTARQNILMSLKRSGLSQAETAARVEEAATTLDIGRLLGKMPSELSGGERQRVATAKAIVRQPAVFLLDEPLAALDAALRLTLRSELVNLQKRLSTTMIFVTHDQVEAMTMGDRIAVMRSGRLEQIGTPDKIYNHPETLFVAGFVGSPPMNFFPGEIEAADGELSVRCGPMQGKLPDRYQSLPRTRMARKVTVAVRPQHMRLLGASAVTGMPVTVFAVEHLGKESIAIFETPERTRVRAMVEPEFRARVGEPLRISFDVHRALFFDPTSERPILPTVADASPSPAGQRSIA